MRPTILSFERKLDPSDALFFSGDWDSRATEHAWAPVKLREKRVRGTVSNDLKAGEQDTAKLNQQIDKPNPQHVDVATLPLNSDTLKVQFTLRVIGNIGDPVACGDPEYRTRLLEVVNAYMQDNGLRELARRYATNIANGRFLWRNRIGAEDVEVVVSSLKNGRADRTWTFRSLNYGLHDLRAPESERESLDELALLIGQGLAGQSHALLRVCAFVRIGELQEVFPSQEMIMERERGSKSKTLYKVGEGDEAVAAMHSQKVGNAIRTIDTWHPNASETGPIPIEPYGAVTSQARAYRQPRPGPGQQPQDLYHLLDKWVDGSNLTLDQKHFVIATLIRGGLFNKVG